MTEYFKMGSGSSKPKPEAPQVVEPVNIMITKEVTERWAALSLKKFQQQQQETKPSADEEKTSTPAVPDGLVTNLTQAQSVVERVESGDEKVHKLTGESV